MKYYSHNFVFVDFFTHLSLIMLPKHLDMPHCQVDNYLGKGQVLLTKQICVPDLREGLCVHRKQSQIYSMSESRNNNLHYLFEWRLTVTAPMN